jgi:hypothetical protein
MMLFLCGYVAGSASLLAALWGRQYVRERRTKRMVEAAVVRFFEGVRTPSVSAPPCNDPRCEACMARKRAAQQAEWNRN